MTYRKRAGFGSLNLEPLESRLQPGETLLTMWWGIPWLNADPLAWEGRTSSADEAVKTARTDGAAWSSPETLGKPSATEKGPWSSLRENARSRQDSFHVPPSGLGQLPPADRAAALAAATQAARVTSLRFNGPPSTTSGCMTPGVLHRMGVAGTQAIDISGDGCTVVGTAGSNFAFRWTQAQGFQNLGGAGGTVGISYDGTTIVGDVRDSQNIVTAGRWTEATGWVSLGGLEGVQPCDRNLSHASGVAWDGSIVVGLGWINNCRGRGFAWHESVGMIQLSGEAGRSSRIYNVSADGAMMVGWNEHPTMGFRRPAMWYLGEEYVVSNDPGEIYNATPYGNVVVGTGGGSSAAVRWYATETEWVRQELGILPGEARAVGVAVSDDGSMVVESSSTAPFSIQAFWWHEAIGMVRLTDLLTYLNVSGLEG